jgi:hypothetical protein
LGTVQKQGSLDGLCGLYSITNAFTRLVSDLDPADVFKQAALALPKRAYPSVLWDGLDVHEVTRSARKVAAWLAERHKAGVAVSTPFVRKRYQTTSVFLDDLSASIQDRSGLAILSVDWGKTKGGGGHWLVYKGHDSARLKVLDSDGPSLMRTRSLSVRGARGDRILEHETVVLIRQ